MRKRKREREWLDTVYSDITAAIVVDTIAIIFSIIALLIAVSH